MSTAEEQRGRDGDGDQVQRLRSPRLPLVARHAGPLRRPRGENHNVRTPKVQGMLDNDTKWDSDRAVFGKGFNKKFLIGNFFKICR